MAYAAIGGDGQREVVWGVGATEGEALEEATDGLLESCGHQCSPSELRTQEITPADEAAIMTGDVGANSLGRANQRPIAELILDVAAALKPLAGFVPEAALEALEETIGHVEAGRDHAAVVALSRAMDALCHRQG